MNQEVKHEEINNRFTVELNGEPAVLKYNKTDGSTIDFTSTHVPEEHRGGKIAENLVRTGLKYAGENDLKVIATCSYVKSFVEKHEEYQELLA